MPWLERESKYPSGLTMDGFERTFLLSMQRNPEDDAKEFGELFPAIYLRFHRRDGKKQALPSASRSVLHHLTLTGPLTIGEMAKHFDRAQSVVSEMVEHLERDGLVERMRDPKDKRRSLVWLSDKGLALLDREREVLSSDLLARAMTCMKAADRRALLRGLHALVETDRRDGPTNERGK
jgi:DNA-binding MarR family transcriptional regulator